VDSPHLAPLQVARELDMTGAATGRFSRWLACTRVFERRPSFHVRRGSFDVSSCSAAHTRFAVRAVRFRRSPFGLGGVGGALLIDSVILSLGSHDSLGMHI